MLKIRFTRLGKKNAPKYRLVVCEQRSKRDSKYVDLLGFYDPLRTPHELTFDEEKVLSWLKKGAQLSEGAYKLLKKRLPPSVTL